MTNIVLPIWMFIIVMGLPSLCLLGLAMHIKNNKQARQFKDESSEQSETPQKTDYFNGMTNNSFQSDLHALQIDAVFNALSALVETERLKLKSLLCPKLTAPVNFLEEQNHTETQLDTNQAIDMGISKINLQIAEMAELGESAGKIANQLGISQSEVDLALSINSTPGQDHHQRLEAMA